MLKLAYLNSHFQTGLKNVLDRVILQHTEMKERVEAGDYPESGRDPIRFFATCDVGRGHASWKISSADLQGGTGGNHHGGVRSLSWMAASTR
ncbi:MAG: hypothetical protein U0903_19500 [Planctomycetales bacterium]